MGKTLPSLSEKYWECPILGLQKMPAWYSLYYIYNHDLIVTIKVNYLKSVLESINYKYFSYKYHLTPICQNVYIVFICNSINIEHTGYMLNYTFKVTSHINFFLNFRKLSLQSANWLQKAKANQKPIYEC